MLALAVAGILDKASESRADKLAGWLESSREVCTESGKWKVESGKWLLLMLLEWRLDLAESELEGGRGWMCSVLAGIGDVHAASLRVRGWLLDLDVDVDVKRQVEVEIAGASKARE